MSTVFLLILPITLVILVKQSAPVCACVCLYVQSTAFGPRRIEYKIINSFRTNWAFTSIFGMLVQLVLIPFVFKKQMFLACI